MARDELYHRFAGRSDWQRNNDGRFRTLWRHCRALRRHCYYTLLLAYLCAIGIGCVWYPDSGGADLIWMMLADRRVISRCNGFR